MSKQTYLIRPFDHLIIRQNPIYRDTYFVLEQVTEGLDTDKERATSKDFPCPESPEQFLNAILSDRQWAERTGNVIVARKVHRSGWVRIEAEKCAPIEQVWQAAMKKVGQKDFYNPQKIKS